MNTDAQAPALVQVTGSRGSDTGTYFYSSKCTGAALVNKRDPDIFFFASSQVTTVCGQGGELLGRPVSKLRGLPSSTGQGSGGRNWPGTQEIRREARNDLTVRPLIP